MVANACILWLICIWFNLTFCTDPIQTSHNWCNSSWRFAYKILCIWWLSDSRLCSKTAKIILWYSDTELLWWNWLLTPFVLARFVRRQPQAQRLQLQWLILFPLQPCLPPQELECNSGLISIIQEVDTPSRFIFFLLMRMRMQFLGITWDYTTSGAFFYVLCVSCIPRRGQQW